MTKDEALDKALEALTALLDEWTPARQAQLKGMEAVTAIKQARSAPVQEPLSFNCSAGCGSCGVKLQDFVTHQTQAQEGDEWVVVATEPQIVSTCCGSPVEVWDERKQDITASVDATPPAAQRQWVGLTDEEIGSAYEEAAAKINYCAPSHVQISRAIEAKLKEKNT